MILPVSTPFEPTTCSLHVIFVSGHFGYKQQSAQPPLIFSTSSSSKYNSAEVFSKTEEAPVKEQSSQLNLEPDSEMESESEEGSRQLLYLFSTSARYTTT